jgi:hypothetical protein
MLVIPRYYYIGKPEDTMRDPRGLRLWRSIGAAVMHSNNAELTILLLYDRNHQLLGAKDVGEELRALWEWYVLESRRVWKGNMRKAHQKLDREFIKQLKAMVLKSFRGLV